jgi:hypothetical protein
VRDCRNGSNVTHPAEATSQIPAALEEFLKGRRVIDAIIKF